MKIDDYARSLGIKETGRKALIEIFKKLGYDDIHEDLEVEGLKIDYGLISYGEDKFGLVVMVGDFSKENVVKLMGICKLVDAKYGILTDMDRFEVFRGKERLDMIPDSFSLKIELGLIDVGALALNYDEFEKIDDVDFVVENSRYVYSDVDRGEVIVLSPSTDLMSWLRDREIDFRIVSGKDVEEIILKFFAMDF